MLVSLSRSYPARAGAPVIAEVDPAIFTHRYFSACLACGFCNDACCTHGVDVDLPTAGRILAERDALVAFGVPAVEWFGSAEEDDDMPGGASTRTRVLDGTCVFRNRRGRGCLLHAYASATGRDYHELKPVVSALFPITFGDGVLWLSDELEDGTLVCGGRGPTAYEGVRGELAWYFGDDLVSELDRLARAATLPAAG